MKARAGTRPTGLVAEDAADLRMMRDLELQSAPVGLPRNYAREIEEKKEREKKAAEDAQRAADAEEVKAENEEKKAKPAQKRERRAAEDARRAAEEARKIELRRIASEVILL